MLSQIETRCRPKVAIVADFVFQSHLLQKKFALLEARKKTFAAALLANDGPSLQLCEKATEEIVIMARRIDELLVSLEIAAAAGLGGEIADSRGMC